MFYGQAVTGNGFKKISEGVSYFRTSFSGLTFGGVGECYPQKAVGVISYVLCAVL